MVRLVGRGMRFIVLEVNFIYGINLWRGIILYISTYDIFKKLISR